LGKIFGGRLNFCRGNLLVHEWIYAWRGNLLAPE
jgi:hypothetical protein